MNDATRLRIRRELAERMGWQYRPECCRVNSNKRNCWMDDDGNCHSAPPDPFTSHEDAAALVEWLAEQKIAVLERFGRVLSHALDLEHEIDNSELQHYHLLEFLASPLKTRVLAACAALGISTED